MNPYRVRTLTVTASTNDDAKAAAEAGEAEGLVIHALQQAAGRGRHGRQWQSPEGNLYCSILLRPADRKSYGLYGFVASLAARDTVRAFLPTADIALKWPNDVLVGGKKISGILLEAGEGYLIVGVGLNVKHHPENALYPCTSLYAEINKEKSHAIPLPSREGLGEGVFGNPNTGNNVRPPHLTSPSRGEELRHADFDITHILESLLSRLWHWHGVMTAEGFAPVRAAWLENARKGRMTVKLPDVVVEGVFESVDAEGHLRLRLADGAERAIPTGDVFFGE